jgi:hypothetical protein
MNLKEIEDWQNNMNQMVTWRLQKQMDQEAKQQNMNSNLEHDRDVE